MQSRAAQRSAAQRTHVPCPQRKLQRVHTLALAARCASAARGGRALHGHRGGGRRGGTGGRGGSSARGRGRSGCGCGCSSQLGRGAPPRPHRHLTRQSPHFSTTVMGRAVAQWRRHLHILLLGLLLRGHLLHVVAWEETNLALRLATPPAAREGVPHHQLAWTQCEFICTARRGGHAATKPVATRRSQSAVVHPVSCSDQRCHGARGNAPGSCGTYSYSARSVLWVAIVRGERLGSTMGGNRARSRWRSARSTRARAHAVIGCLAAAAPPDWSHATCGAARTRDITGSAHSTQHARTTARSRGRDKPQTQAHGARR